MLTITIASILGITCVAWLANKILPFRVCPICAGVSGTWLWMLSLSLLGYEIDLAILAMLLGGSVVGIAYQLEKKLPARKSALLWKTLFIPTGFVSAYSLVLSRWGAFVVSFIILCLLAWIFVKVRPRQAQTTQEVEGIKKKMENCC